LRPARADVSAAGVALIVVLAALAVAAAGLPVEIVAGAAVLAMGVLLYGPELVIVLSLLASVSLLPFVDAKETLFANIKLYFAGFCVAGGVMAGTWLLRQLAGRPAFPLRTNGVVVMMLLLLGYVLLVLAATDPLAQPSLAAPFLAFPAIAVATYLWLAHPESLDGIRRLLPLIVLLLIAWAVMDIAGSAGCRVCADYVGADQSNAGLLGPNSRLYTGGQNSFLVIAVLAAAAAIYRATPLHLGLAVIAMATVAVQASRAQYLAVTAALLLLLLWRLRTLRTGGRFALVGIFTVAAVAVALSPVGARAASGYEDASTSTGTSGYRLALIERSRDNWTTLGAGITARTLDLGVNQDLGLPNTLIVLGIVGAVLQIGLLIAGILRGLAARTAVGTALAAVLLMALVARPSLPLLELGTSSLTLGVVIGFAAWLGVAGQRRDVSVS
jgi:hypothetical protein